MRQPALIIPLDRPIQTPIRQPPLGAGDAALHAARDDRHDVDAQGLEFDAQGVGVGVQGRFGGVVDGAEDVGDDGGDGADLHDRAAGGDEEWGEGLADVHDGEEVCFEGGAGFGEGDVEGGNGVVWLQEMGQWVFGGCVGGIGRRTTYSVRRC